MERRGSGLKKIIESYKNEEHYKEELTPTFESTHSSFFVTLKNLNYGFKGSVPKENELNQGVEENVPESVPKDVPKALSRESRLKEIEKIIRVNKDITIIQLSKRFGVSEKTIKRDVKKLQDDNIIVRVGSPKTGHWDVAK